MSKKTYVVGDIHGAYLALVQAFLKAPIAKGDRIIFLGDYVDGWSQSAEVVQFLLKLEEDYECIFIRGNHDAWCEKWMTTGVRENIWVSQGGKATIESYVDTGHITDDKHRMFFHKLHNYFIDEENRGFVHGGYNSKNGLGNEHYASDYYWDRDLWELAVANHHKFDDIKEQIMKDPYDEFFRPNPFRFLKHKEVFIGHTSTVNWRAKPHLPEWEAMDKKPIGITVPMNRCNVWNMDTGAGWHGKLTIMDVDTKEYWQSDLVKTLYPDELGR